MSLSLACGFWVLAFGNLTHTTDTEARLASDSEVATPVDGEAKAK